MLSRSFTKDYLQLNQLKHKHLPPQIDFGILQNNTMKPVHYLIKHEEELPHQKHGSHPILVDFGTDRVSIRINYKDNDIVVNASNSFSFKSVTPFPTNFKTPTRKNNKSVNQQSLSLNDTDIASDDDEHIYSRYPKHKSTFITVKTLHEETFTTIKKPMSIKPPESTSAIDVHTNPQSSTHCSHIIPFYDSSFFKYKIHFQGFFLPDDCSLDLKTLQQQQSQDPVLRTVHSWLTRNEKLEFLTPLITGIPFLAYYKRFSQLFTDDSTNLISLYIKYTVLSETHPNPLPNTIHDTI